MNKIDGILSRLENRWMVWLEKYAITFLRISIGIIYFVFGMLKFFPQYSPAEQLAADTICLITFDVLSGTGACLTLAIIETAIGLSLIINFRPRVVFLVTIWHMLCTFLPLIILPEYAFSQDPFSLSIVGQYIFKNLIILSALMVLYKNLHNQRQIIAQNGALLTKN